jgi:hypothetical protein
VVEVSAGEPRPALLELDAESVAAEADRLEQRGADAAHRVDDEVAGVAVGADRAPRQFGQHLARVALRLG